MTDQVVLHDPHFSVDYLARESSVQVGVHQQGPVPLVDLVDGLARQPGKVDVAGHER